MACTVLNACRRDVAANRSRTGHSARVECAHPGRPSAESGRMKQFIHDMRTGRLIFGAGSVAQLSDEIARIGQKRQLLLSTPEQLELLERFTSLATNNAVYIVAPTQHYLGNVTNIAHQKIE